MGIFKPRPGFQGSEGGQRGVRGAPGRDGQHLYNRITNLPLRRDGSSTSLVVSRAAGLLLVEIAGLLRKGRVSQAKDVVRTLIIYPLYTHPDGAVGGGGEQHPPVVGRHHRVHAAAVPLVRGRLPPAERGRVPQARGPIRPPRGQPGAVR
eukprot:1195712-Prorocentrum_minimum.AAC.7